MPRPATPSPVRPAAAPRASFTREKAAYAAGHAPVAGVDEVGRGPLAGPVVVAAVVLDPARVPRGLSDSKLLPAPRREDLFERIMATAEVSVVAAPPTRIDRDNILQATLWAMRAALAALPRCPGLAFIDGNTLPRGLPCRAEAIVDGDALVASIAAASIVAKVTRDRLMRRLGLAHPGYGFERHVGYATPEHRSALTDLGPTIHHRRSFAPVRECLPPDARPAIADVDPLLPLLDIATAG